MSVIPIEFQAALAPRLENLEWHLANTSASKIGDSATFYELAEDVGFCTLLMTGQHSAVTQKNFRTLFFDAQVESVDRWTREGVDIRARAGFAAALKHLETAIQWFSSSTPPQSKAYSLAHASMTIARGRTELERLDAEGSRANRPKSDPAEVACSSCRTTNEADARFCKKCGLPIV